MDDLLYDLKRSIDYSVAEAIMGTHPLVFPRETIRVCLPTPSKINKMRVIFNNPATILIVGDKKFISKVHNEEFDEEKGLLMCLAKANGYSHADLKTLLKTAKRHAKKV